MENQVSNNKYVLEVNNLTKSFGSNHVIKGVSLHLAKGESYVIIGGSGSGKSVLLKCILGIIPPTSGQVILHGTNMVGLDPKEISRIFAGMVQRYFSPSLSALA